MTRLIVISGPANSGKMPLALKLLEGDSVLALVHRDHLRDHLRTKLDEWHITLLMADLARGLLRLGVSPIICAWNLDPHDRHLWEQMADEHEVPLEWLDTREPHVAAMIPPLKEPCQSFGATTA